MDRAAMEDARATERGSERKTLAVVALLAASLLLAPRQWVSAGLMFALAVGFYVWHLITRKRERAHAAPATPAAAPNAPAAAPTTPKPDDRRDDDSDDR